MDKKNKTVVTEISIHAELEEVKNAFPMVGWHNPYATFEVDGKEWTISIAGGCRAITVTPPGGKHPKDIGFFSVDIGQIVAAMVPEIQKRLDAL